VVGGGDYDEKKRELERTWGDKKHQQRAAKITDLQGYSMTNQKGEGDRLKGVDERTAR